MRGKPTRHYYLQFSDGTLENENPRIQIDLFKTLLSLPVEQYPDNFYLVSKARLNVKMLRISYFFIYREGNVLHITLPCYCETQAPKIAKHAVKAGLKWENKGESPQEIVLDFLCRFKVSDGGTVGEKINSMTTRLEAAVEKAEKE